MTENILKEFSQDTPIILSSELKYEEELGKGNFGSVWKGTCRGKEVAIKKYYEQNFTEESFQEFKKDVEVCCRIYHPNVILFMGACLEDKELIIVTEHLPQGSLDKLLYDPNRFYSLNSRLKMAFDIAQGVNWLHCSKPPIIHLHLKPSNLLVDEYGNIKVSDFGFTSLRSAWSFDSESSLPLWMAPELIQDCKVSEKVDVYSFGIVLWEIVNIRPPFQDIKTLKDFEETVCTQKIRPPLSDSLPDSLKFLIEDCWQDKSQDRPSFSEIIERLKDVLVDCVVSDEHGRGFWIRKFGTRESVSWEEFIEPFCNMFVGAPPVTTSPEYKCLKFLLSKRSTDTTLRNAPDIVTLSSFGDILSWFGPLNDIPDTTCSNILEYILKVAKEKWFHGHISTEDAVNRLKNYSKGHFLIRLSTTVPGRFTISKVDRDKVITHQRIDYKFSSGFSIRFRDRKSGTLKVITEHKIGLQKFIKKISSSFGLVTPCPGRSPEFEQFHMKLKSNPVSGYVL